MLLGIPCDFWFDILLSFGLPGRSHLALISENHDVIEECWKKNCDLPVDVNIIGLCTIEVRMPNIRSVENEPHSTELL